jgi:hypothetical protein
VLTLVKPATQARAEQVPAEAEAVALDEAA